MNGAAREFRDATIATECREHPGPVIVEITGEEILNLPDDGRAKAFLMARLAAQLRLERDTQTSWDERESRGVRAAAARELLLELEIDRLKTQADKAYALLAEQARQRTTVRRAS